MANGLGHLWRLLSGPHWALDETDDELMRRYLQHRDEGTFEALVRRHAALVFGVCRRVLRDSAAAEDAFQATFLLLLRKADTIRRREALACWLYGVAYRVAVRARVNERRRRQKEKEAAAMKPVPAGAEVDGLEARELLDQEISRLPEKYRAPLILCYLQGQTHEEAARHLGWPSGTVKGRLVRAREVLRGRLGRRGLAVPAGAWVALLAEQASAAPTSWVAATLLAVHLWTKGQTAAGAFSANAVALAEGVMRSMFLKKVMTRGAILVAGFILLGVGAGAAAFGGRGAEPRQAAGLPVPVSPKVATKDLAPTAKGQPVQQAVQDAAPAQDPSLPKGAVARLGQPVKLTDLGASTAAYSLDGKRIAWVTTAAANPKSTITFHVWDLKAQKEIARCEFAEDTAMPTATVAFGPEGKTLVVATRHEVALGPGKSQRYGLAQIRLFDADKGKELPRFKGHRAGLGSEFRTLAFTPDGKAVVSDHDMQVQVWDVASGKLVREFAFASEDDGGGISYEVLSPGGQVFASCLNADPVRLFDVTTGKKICEIKDAGAPVALSADGKVLAAVAMEEIRLWSVETGKVLAAIARKADAALPAVFSADGKLLAWGDREKLVHVTAVATRKEIAVFPTDGGWVAFAPDSRTLAAVCPDGTVLLWEVPGLLAAPGKEEGP
jgi:RNA polymerase sigma factor (sigma-70 family)